MNRRNLCQLSLPIRAMYHEIVKQLFALSMTSTALCAFNAHVEKFPAVAAKLRESVSWPWSWKIIQDYRLGRHDLRNSVSKIETPTLLVAPKRGKLFAPGGLRYLNEHMPNSCLVELNSNHDLLYGSPFSFYRVFSEFINIKRSAL